jgi:hypothetical protein
MGEIYTNVMEYELPVLLKDIHLHTDRQTKHQQTGAPANLSRRAKMGQTVYPGRRQPIWTLFFCKYAVTP